MGLGKLISKVPIVGKPASKLLFGEETGPQFNPYQERPMTAEEKALQLESNKAALSGLQSLQSERYTPEQEAQMKAGLSQFQASQDVTNLRQGVEDARRKMQQQIAARGLQNTSIGLGQLAGQERDIGRAQAQALNQYQYQQAATPLEAERIKRERALNLMNAARGQQIRSEFDTGKASSRQGGLLPLAGAVAGGIASGGSPQGIQAGMGAGQVASTMY